jgi:DNA-binding CsgD family transcriptional regulator
MSVYGRDEELAGVESFLVELRSGPLVLSLEGPAGAGKTTLWQDAIVRAGASGCRVLQAQPVEAEATLPFGVLSDLFGEVEEAALAALGPPQRRALEVALARAEASPAGGDRLALGLALRTLLETMAAQSPVVLAVDDLQWADPSSARALEFAIRRLAGDLPVALIASIRTSGADRLPLPLEPERVRRVPVGALERDAFLRLVHERLGGALPRPLAIRLHEATEGNPLLGLEVGRMLVEQRSLPGPDEPLPVPSSTAEFLRRRLTRLDEGVRELLLACALLARPTIGVLEAAFPETNVRAALATAVDAELVSVARERVRFSHPLLSTALESEVTPRARRAAHARVAAVLAEPEQQALHRALAADGPDESVAAQLDEAAARARQRGAPDGAALLLEHAARLTPTSRQEEAFRRVLGSAEANLVAGNLQGARSLLNDVLEVLPPGPDRARALLLRARTGEADLPEAVKDGEAALGAALGDAALETEIRRFLADVTYGLGNGAAYLEHTVRGLEAAERSGSAELLAVALCDLCLAEFYRGDGLRRDLLERALALPADPEQLPLIERPQNVEGGLLKRTGEVDRARAILDDTRRLALERGDVPAQYLTLLDLADLELRAGNPRRALDLAERAIPLGEQVGVDGIGAGATRARASALLDLGRLDEARAAADRAFVLADEAGIDVYRRSARRVLALVDLAEGRADRALPPIREFRERMWAMGLRDPSSWAEPPELDALIALGLLDEAEWLAADLAERALALDRPLSRAVAARFAGLVASLRGEHDAAAAAFAEALEQHERVQQPLERARTLLALGTVHRRAKRRALARTALEEAARLFEGVGASREAGLAASRLGRLGLRRGDRHELTPMERKVAEVIAGGATTREAAAALFLSPKTVEFHLANAYRKLDVRSRAQLARAFPAS